LKRVEEATLLSSSTGFWHPRKPKKTNILELSASQKTKKTKKNQHFGTIGLPENQKNKKKQHFGTIGLPENQKNKKKQKKTTFWNHPPLDAERESIREY
jgi:hypothetical protein